MTQHSPNPTQDRNGNQIDRILNALRDTTPPTGMDRRILNILEAQSSQKGASTGNAFIRGVIPSEPKASRGIPVFSNTRTTTLLRWTTTAAVAALLIAAAVTLTSHRRTTQPTTATAPKTPTSSQTIAIATTHITPHPATSPAHLKHTQPQIAEVPQPAEDAQLSHPAPPIPLTDQERLLLRYTSRGRTEDLAQISNDRNAAKEQKDAADFQAFFTPPEIPIGESE